MKTDWNETSVDEASVTDCSFNASALYLCGSFSFLSAKICPKQLKFSGKKSRTDVDYSQMSETKPKLTKV